MRRLSSPEDVDETLVREIVGEVVASAFRDGELASWETERREVEDRPPFASFDCMVSRCLFIEIWTARHDRFSCVLWQPDVPPLSTLEGIVQHVIYELESWLPESAVAWGENRRVEISARASALMRDKHQ